MYGVAMYGFSDDEDMTFVFKCNSKTFLQEFTDILTKFGQKYNGKIQVVHPNGKIISVNDFE